VAAIEVMRDLGRFRSRWDELVAQMAPPPMFLRSWWLESLASATSCYVCVFDGDDLIGGLAVDLRRLLPWGFTLVRPLGVDQMVTAIHLDAVHVPARRAVVVTALHDWFCSLGGGLAVFRGVRPRSALREALPVAPTPIHTADAPVVRLEGDYEAFLAARSANWRSNLRRNQRRLADAGYRYRRLAAEELPTALSALRRLHLERHGPTSQFGPFLEGFGRAAHTGAARGELAFHVVARDQHIAAIDAVLEVGGSADYFQGGRVTGVPQLQGTGTVLLAAIIEDAYARGFVELDLEVEADAYKLRLTDEVRPVYLLESSWGPGGRIIAGARAARTVGSDFPRRARALARRGGPAGDALSRPGSSRRPAGRRR
jgi:GNAT superfamily N-acetyltransferase